MKSGILAAAVMAGWLSMGDPDIISVKGAAMFPGGILRNNPGNLIQTDDDWVGATKLQDHKRFVRFLQPVYGIRALMKTLLTYQDKHDLTTITKIINRWAPPVENNTKEYIKEVSIDSGFAPDALIDLHVAYNLVMLSKAIVMYENGNAPTSLPIFWYVNDTYYDAAEMALGEE